MSEHVTLTCTTLIDGREAKSTIALSREDWDELPEDVREWERNRVRAMHADGLQAEQGVSVDPASLVVKVDVVEFRSAGPVRPDEEPT